jgi:hypothetical protein
MYKRVHNPYINVFSNSTNESKMEKGKENKKGKKRKEEPWKGHYQT